MHIIESGAGMRQREGRIHSSGTDDGKATNALRSGRSTRFRAWPKAGSQFPWRQVF